MELTLTYDEIEYIVAFILNFEQDEIPDTLREEILPKLQDFLGENYDEYFYGDE